MKIFQEESALAELKEESTLINTICDITTNNKDNNFLTSNRNLYIKVNRKLVKKNNYLGNISFLLRLGLKLRNDFLRYHYILDNY